VTLPKRIMDDKPKKQTRLRCPAHLKFIRQHFCCVPGCDRRPIEAAHVRHGTDPQALGAKPGDNWTISLCSDHHRQLHANGSEADFEAWHGINLIELAREFWAKSPHRKRAEAKAR